MWHVARTGTSRCFDPHAVDQPLAARYGLRFRAIPLLSAPPELNVPRGFSKIFPQRDTLSHSKLPPRGGPPPGGLAGAILGAFVVAPKAAFEGATWARAFTST